MYLGSTMDTIQLQHTKFGQVGFSVFERKIKQLVMNQVGQVSAGRFIWVGQQPIVQYHVHPWHKLISAQVYKHKTGIVIALTDAAFGSILLVTSLVSFFSQLAKDCNVVKPMIIDCYSQLLFDIQCKAVLARISVL